MQTWNDGGGLVWCGAFAILIEHLFIINLIEKEERDPIRRLDIDIYGLSTPPERGRERWGSR